MTKNGFVIILLSLAIIICFSLPKSKYKSPNILPTLNIPMDFAGWKGTDISKELNAQNQYSFINNIFARRYENAQGEKLFFLILDAGNFHNPKVCYGSTGYVIRDLPNTELSVLNRQIKANSIYLQKENAVNLTVIYWLCINKKIVSWSEQKIQELFYSLLNKQKTGLMVRIDTPTTREGAPQAVKLTQEFIKDLSQQLSKEELEYLFGQ